jgi:(5-formylfuran-3-yl)methyl phosphate synthase
MTLMLAGVIDGQEAAIALHGGADIIDFEDPRQGLLAAASWEAIEAGLKAISTRRRRVGAALGAPPYEAEGLAKRVRALIAAGVDAVKLAVDAPSLDKLDGTLRALAPEVRLVGVLWADRTPDLDCLPRLGRIGFKSVLLDTAEKGGKRLLDYQTPSELEAFCARCRAHGLNSALAGSLEPPDVPRLLLVAPSILGFRRALCAGGKRDGPLDARAIDRIRGLIPRKAEAHVTPTADRPSQNSAPSDENECDLVFIRDFLASADLGAYKREHGSPQRVVFNVEASVERARTRADDMRAVFSYDVILDAIRLVTGRGHVNFIETIAEDVAEIVLNDSRVRRVRVRVEKLDIIEGAVGVEITRERVDRRE